MKLSPSGSWTNGVWSRPPSESDASAPTVVVVETAAVDPAAEQGVTVDSETVLEPRARRARRPRTSSGRRERREPRAARASTGKRGSHGGGHGGGHGGHK
jgi:hypothetical protein